eukprot:CAMPEP_0115335090 /NCGR_PEP_ID=MMETSP0270-20121206/88254_1 /TAXON_ID=71861 /ORGANISM="Scrippsiella trochoidea, Strain CCMP3099" /LENGTH=103 /DNA_ID=CAMNT_0002756107 /DNA_START=35 /DNA_END=346 /DNA_ORIENTATION=+
MAAAASIGAARPKVTVALSGFEASATAAPRRPESWASVAASPAALIWTLGSGAAAGCRDAGEARNAAEDAGWAAIARVLDRCSVLVNTPEDDRNVGGSRRQKA